MLCGGMCLVCGGVVCCPKERANNKMKAVEIQSPLVPVYLLIHDRLYRGGHHFVVYI